MPDYKTLQILSLSEDKLPRALVRAWGASTSWGDHGPLFEAVASLQLARLAAAAELAGYSVEESSLPSTLVVIGQRGEVEVTWTDDADDDEIGWVSQATSNIEPTTAGMLHALADSGWI